MLPEGAALLGEDLTVRLTNEKWNEIFMDFKLSPEQSGYGNKYPDILLNAGCSEETVEKLRNKIEDLIEGDEKEFEEEIAFEIDGEVRWCEVKISGYKNDVLILKEDITEEKKREKKQKADALFESSTSAIAMLDSAGNIVDINEEFRETFGYSLKEVKGEPLDDVMEWGKAGYSDREETARILAGEKIMGEGTRYDSEGNPKEFLCRGVPIVIENKVEGAYVLYDDITEYKSAEKELEMTKFFLDNADMMVFRVTPDGEILYANERVSEKLGYSRRELEKIEAHDIIAQDDYEKREKFWLKIKQNNSISYEKTFVTAEGETFPVSVVSQYFNYEGEEYEFVFAQDITRRKEMEEKSRIKEEQYRKIFESAPIGMELKNSEGIIIDVNEKLCEITGYEKEELIGESVFDAIVPEAYRERAKEDFNKVLSGRELEQILSSRKKSGEHYYVNLKDTKLKLPGGEEGVLSMRTDITDRLEAENKLKEEKERFRSLAETSPFALFVYQEKFQYVNSTLEHKTGYSQKELLDMNFWEVVAPEHREIVKERGLARLRGEEPPSNYEFKLQKKTGEEMWILFSGAQIVYEGENAAIGTAIDITDRKEAEEKLEIKEEQYRKIFETAPVGIMLEDSEGNILEVNERLCEITGFAEEELVGSNVLDVLTPPEYREEARRNIEMVIEGKDLEFTGDGRRKNGESYKVHLNETRVKLPRGGEGILSIQMDITELKEKEERLKYLSYHDGLTGLYNRSYIEEEMKRLDTVRQLPISLIMCDVNGMKIINDTYGHRKGDELLNEVAEILKGVTRDEDIVSRWAGDEFVILLPRTEAKMAENIVARIERACEGAQFEDIPITLGIGIATKRDSDEKFEDVLIRADEKMYKDKLTKVNSAENRLLQNMLNTLAAKSAETKEHAMRMTELAHKLGDKAGLSGEQLNRLSLLATLHDIGKTTISQDILTKPEGLTDEEWQIIKEHPERGHTIITATDDFAHISREVLHHHECWDGSGYPEGLKEDDIPLLSRMISIVDAYDVMTTGRPYKEPMSQKEALEEIKDCAGSQFDPELAELFVEMMREE